MADKNASSLTRRSFIKATSATAVVAGLAPKRLRAANSPAPPSERIRLGFIGIGGRGAQLMNDFHPNTDCQVSAVCDVYETNRLAAAERAGSKPEQYKDFRDLLDKAKVDAVVVATPPHWHPLISIAALNSGHDVYCEKPISLHVDEACAMTKAARENRRVTQVGTQIHAQENFRRAVEIVKSGALGKICNVRVEVMTNEYPGSQHLSPATVPDGLDWDMWLGPVQSRAFHTGMFTTHRYYRDMVHSWLNELGPHIMDLAIWAMNPGEPSAVQASGGRFGLRDDSDIPDTVDAVFEYPDLRITFMHSMVNGYNFGFAQAPDKGRRLAVFFHGSNGTLAADYGSMQLYLEGISVEDFKPEVQTIPSSPGHQREFLDSVKSRKQPSCNLDYHLPMAIALNLAHASLFSGEKVGWDAGNGKIIGSKKARDFGYHKYRSPWKLQG